MNVTVLQENLEKGLSFINHIVSQHPQLPILSHVLIKTTKDGLTLSATDLEVGIKLTIGAKINKEGELTVPARLLLDLITNLPHEKVTLIGEKQVLTIETVKTKSTILGVAATEFPSIFEGEKEIFLQITGKTLKEVLGKICFAAATDEGRPVLTGVLLTTGDTITMVGTDGYRLSIKRGIEGQQKKGKGGKREETDQLIVPARILKQLLLLLAQGEEESVIHFYLSKGKNQVVIEATAGTLVGRIIDGDYPSYDKVIPESRSTETVLDREEFQQAVKTSAIFARASANIVRMKLTKDGVTLSANSPQVGENTVAIDATVSGEENEIAFNSRFLLEFLANIDAKEIIFEMTGPLNPGVFKLKDDDSFLHIIMPVRIQAEKSE